MRAASPWTIGGDVRLRAPLALASDASSATSMRPSKHVAPLAVQQRDRRGGLPGRRDRVGQLAFFVEQVGQATLDPIGFDDDQRGTDGLVEQRARFVDEERHPPFHAVEELSRGEPVERRPSPRQHVDHPFGATARVIVQEPFARRCDDGLLEVVQRTLVGDVEGRQSFDLVAEEVESNRLVSLRRPDVDDAAAHRELRAVLDEALAPVAAARE